MTVTQRNQKYCCQIIWTRLLQNTKVLYFSKLSLQTSRQRRRKLNRDAASQVKQSHDVFWWVSRLKHEALCCAFFLLKDRAYANLPKRFCSKCASRGKFICTRPFKHKGNSKWETSHIPSSSKERNLCQALHLFVYRRCLSQHAIARKFARADFSLLQSLSAVETFPWGDDLRHFYFPGWL